MTKECENHCSTIPYFVNHQAEQYDAYSERPQTNTKELAFLRFAQIKLRLPITDYLCPSTNPKEVATSAMKHAQNSHFSLELIIIVPPSI